MFFTKYPHASNFSFAETIDARSGQFTAGRRPFRLTVEAFEGGVYRLRIANGKVWKPTRRIVELEPGPAATSNLDLRAGGFTLRDDQGKTLLETAEGQGIGVSGEASMFQFDVDKSARFFGMGEKNFGKLELSGLRAKFWNTDVWGDFHFAQWLDHPTDPPYASVPYLIVRQRGVYIGLLLDNPYPTFMETPGRPGGPQVFVEWQRTSPRLILGSEGGEPCLWILVGPTLAELTRKLQNLVGRTPRPPVWALGYHQSRWGYAGEKDLLDLDRKFREHRIPCDGLWLDIDYMEGYRVFTIDKKHFRQGLSKTAAALAKSGRRIVAILDPGVKFEPGLALYEDGRRKDVYCRNPEGKPFVGMVWPGETVFPDFSIAKGRDWWASQVRSFVKEGFGGFWIDMNDPSTGPVDPTGMLFNAGREPHAAHHNDYALGMQKATFEGVRSAYPSRRPFVLSRSAFTGTSRFSAVWTGDNLSNRFYLKLSIPTTLGLAMSGIPFNGPDIGGFGGDTNERLIVDWMKAGFLFPFCRNHTSGGTRNQEPWAFTQRGLRSMRRYIRLRYRLMPYLYQLFVRQSETGEAILRPLLHDFAGPFDEVADQFLVGPWIMQAPLLEEGAKQRTAVLPGKAPWFDARSGVWRAAGSIRVPNDFESTPLFVGAGAIVPMRRGEPSATRTDLRRPEFHLFAPAGWTGETIEEYVADDGETTAYRRGKQSRIQVRFSGGKGGLEVFTKTFESGFGAVRATLVLHGPRRPVTLNGMRAKLTAVRVTLTGKPLRAWRVEV